jgi:hypothetical protein
MLIHLLSLLATLLADVQAEAQGTDCALAHLLQPDGSVLSQLLVFHDPNRTGGVRVLSRPSFEVPPSLFRSRL